ncbi:hypothetical protein [Undibacterium sp. SXout20W]|uniref:hypothetical protein n=1 Tax=Undibacterium sp. SXout20W TaxID=3413051 RepID=UPI003BF10399
MKTLIRYSACIVVTGVVFSSGYFLGQHQAAEQAANLRQQAMSALISDSASQNKQPSDHQLPRRKPALLM